MTKKIALIYDAIYPYIKGGGEKRYYEIAKRLAIKGHEVHLYGMKLWKGRDVIRREGIYLHGICPAKHLYTKDGRRSIWQAILFGIHCLKLIKEDFDVIDCCGFPYFSLFACKIVCLLKGKKLYSTWYEVWGKDYWKSYLKFLWMFGYAVEKLAVRIPDKIIAISSTTASRIKNELGYFKPIVVIPNGVDLKKILKIKPAKEKSDVIFAGRLLNHKNVDVLIKSIRHSELGSESILKCLIIGDGPEKNKLLKLSNKLKLEKNVQFTGFFEKHEDVYALIKSSKVFILPSTREGFGIVVIEANACGIPVITTNHKANAAKNLIKEGKNGFICQLNEEEIARRIALILKNGIYRKMEKKCMKTANKYDWDKITNRVKEIYLK